MQSGRPFAILLAARQGEIEMQVIITFMAVVAGLVFSVAVALLVEELIFGQVFRIFFTPQPVRVEARLQR
jgi:cytochrome c oxidase subunit IV